MKNFTEEELSVLALALRYIDKFIPLTDRETRIANDLYGRAVDKLGDIENSEYGV